MATNLDTTVQTIMQIITQKIEKLLNNWNEVGHNETVIENRLKSVITYASNYFDELVDESENEKIEILDEIDVALKKIKSLRQRLRIPGVMEGYTDTPLVLLISQFQDLIKKYEEEIQSKLQNINKLIQNEAVLCRKLGIGPKKLQTKPLLPTPDEIKNFEEYVERMNQQVFELDEQFLQIKSDITQMLDDLGKRPITDFECEVINNDDNTFILSTEHLNKLKLWQKTLKHDVQERRGEINELRQKLLSLWELLEENPEHRTKFINEIDGIGDETVRKLKDELRRCEEKKKAHIKEYVDKYRNEIEKWWEICMYGTKQKSDFIALFKSECYTDDLLMLHELQLEKLKLYYNNNKKIFDLLKKRDKLWKRTVYLSECANNKDRFKNRGGELLKEEKERKEVNVQLPQIENHLLTEIQAYKQLHQADFLINDLPLENIIHENLNQFREKQSAKLSAKKKQRDITLTPNPNGRSILTQTNLTASKRKAPQPLRNVNHPSTIPKKRSKADGEQPQPSSISKSVQKQQPQSGSTRSRTVPKLKVNNQTIGKVSYCVRRRLCPTKRLSKEGANHSRSRKVNQQSSQTSTESCDEFYNQFKVGISSRSSTVHQQKENTPVLIKTPQKTPSRSPHTSRRTPRTPATPRTAVRLQVASPLPLLF